MSPVVPVVQKMLAEIRVISREIRVISQQTLAKFCSMLYGGILALAATPARLTIGPMHLPMWNHQCRVSNGNLNHLSVKVNSGRTTTDCTATGLLNAASSSSPPFDGYMTLSEGLSITHRDDILRKGDHCARHISWLPFAETAIKVRMMIEMADDK